MPASRQKATRQQIKSHNKRLILKTIYERGKISRAEIARVTRLTRPTVSSIVAELMNETLVAEVGQTSSSGGKPATLLSVVNDSLHLIGIDLADSEFRGCLINLRGEICHRIALPVDNHNGEGALALVYKLIDQLLAVARSPLLGIGIGSPGLMDAANGIVRRAVNLDWHDLPLRQRLTERYDLPVYIANDGQAAALAEYTFGKKKNISNLLVIKIGLGVGAGIIINGQLFHGDGFGAGEIGHVRMVNNGDLCRCGNKGCLETLISSRTLLAQARHIAQTDPTSALAAFADTPNSLTFEEIVHASATDDPALNRALARMGHYLGQALAAMVATLNIRHIVISGMMAQFGTVFLAPIQKSMVAHAPPFLVDDTVLALSELGQDMVVLGASALVLANELGIV